MDIEKVKTILESINELSKASEENTFEKIVKDASGKDKVKYKITEQKPYYLRELEENGGDEQEALKWLRDAIIETASLAFEEDFHYLNASGFQEWIDYLQEACDAAKIVEKYIK